MKLTAFVKRYIYFILSFLLALYYISVSRAGVYDWEKEIFYIQYIKQSIFHLKTLPYYLWNNNGLGNYPVIAQGNLFIGNPETVLFSPWIFFLSVLKPVDFLKLFYLIHLILAVIGILLLARKLNWDIRQMRIFSGLFLFSPIILQHIAIGYTPWINLFLFPLLMYFQFYNKRLVSVIGSAMVFSLIILQGGIHIAVWLLGFILFTKLWQAILYKNISAFLDFFGVIFLSGLLAFARIYFSFIALHDFWQQSFPGFSISSFLQMALKLPLFFLGKIDDIESYFEFKIDGLPYWDAGVYWGPFLIVILSLLVFLLFKSKKQEGNFVNKFSLSILLSSLSILILSFGNIFSSMTGYLSQMTGLLAFEGVEKYPFRFSLLAYFGLSLWFVASGINVIQDICVPEKKGDHKQVSYLGSTEIRKRLPAIMAVVFCFLGLGMIAWFTWGKLYLLNQIRNAFYGSGLPLLEKMMGNKENLSVGVYLNKALTLSNWLIYFMVLILVLCMIGFLYIKYSEYFNKMLLHSFRWFYKNRMAIVEILIILPLGVASLSWMRVATATPVSRFERIMKMEPELEVTSPPGALIDISNSSPGSLHIKCGSAQGQSCEIVVPIKGSELRYFRIVPVPHSQIDMGESQALTISPDVVYQFNIDSAVYKLPILFTLFNWLWTSILLIMYLRKQRRSQV